MTDDKDTDNMSAFDEFGEAFEQKEDPLSDLDDKFKQLDTDPIEVYKEVEIYTQDVTDSNKDLKAMMLDRWKTHMAKYDRHPACPSTSHAVEFINELLLQTYVQDYINKHLSELSKMFQYWIDHPRMPHGSETSEGFNPIDAARRLQQKEIKSQPTSKKKSEYQISIQEIGSRLRDVKNILHRSVLTTQFKYGSRGGQICNIEIPEIQINHEELNDLYPEMGTHPQLQDIDDEVIYFPPRSEKPGNKSEKPIILPIDLELKALLIRYLGQRPPINDSWLFVNNGSGNKLTTDYLTTSMWKPAFHPEYDETDEFEPVTSHYARHRFATYWKKEMDINREYLNYMRGDKANQPNYSDSIDKYVHTYYSDIVDLYMSNIYKFNVV